MNDVLQDKINTLERITSWVENSDSKSSILLALVGVLISIIFTSDFVLTSLQKLIEPISIYWNTGTGAFDWFITFKLMIFICMLGCLLCSLFFLIKSLAAKTSSTQTGDESVMTNSLIHFGSIEKRTYDEFKAAVQVETEDDKLEDVLSQIYINAKRCQEKFNDYNKSIKLVKISIALFVLFAIILIV